MVDTVEWHIAVLIAGRESNKLQKDVLTYCCPSGLVAVWRYEKTLSML